MIAWSWQQTVINIEQPWACKVEFAEKNLLAIHSHSSNADTKMKFLPQHGSDAAKCPTWLYWLDCMAFSPWVLHVLVLCVFRVITIPYWLLQHLVDFVNQKWKLTFELGVIEYWILSESNLTFMGSERPLKLNLKLLLVYNFYIC